MNKMPLPISNGFYVSDALPISNQRCVNLKPNIPQADTVTDANLFNTEGLRQILDLSNLNDTCRGMHVMAGILYAVIGQKLYRIDRTYLVEVAVYGQTDLGTIPGFERVWLADNGTQLCITAVPDALTSGVSYIFTDSPDTLTQITSVNFDGPASSVVYSDGFFIFSKADGKKFFNSSINDGLTYDALDFSQAAADPDNIRALTVNKGQLLVLGSETVQLFRNIGRSPAPYQGIPGGVIDLGVKSPQTVAKFAGGIVFVGSAIDESPSVWMISGATKSKLSTTSIDNELSKLTDDQIGSLFSFVYGESGSFFLGITTPTTTYVYDLTNQRWHERQSIRGNTLTQYRVSHIATAYGLLFVGDQQSGKIGVLDENEYLEYGVLVRRLVTSKPFDNMGNPLHLSQLEVVTENGVGLAADITVDTGEVNGVAQTATGGSDPMITLAWSDNGGRTFEGGLSRSMGKLGEYKKRQVWRRLGKFNRSRVLMLEVTSPTKVTIIKVEAAIRG